MTEPTSVFRLYLLRVLYLINFVLVGAGVAVSFYKTFWLTAVYLPLRAAGRASDLAIPFLIVAILDVVVIPWRYVVAHYVKKRGDRWAAV